MSCNYVNSDDKIDLYTKADLEKENHSYVTDNGYITRQNNNQGDLFKINKFFFVNIFVKAFWFFFCVAVLHKAIWTKVETGKGRQTYQHTDS